MENLSEGKIQQSCYLYFNNTCCLKHHEPRLLMFSIPNEGKNAIEQSRKKATGMLAGVSDTIVVFPNKVLFIEFKDDKGRQSDKQKEFEERVNKLGFEYYVIRSLDEFKQLIKQNR